jgi:hypothetical protein
MACTGSAGLTACLSTQTPQDVAQAARARARAGLLPAHTVEQIAQATCAARPCGAAGAACLASQHLQHDFQKWIGGARILLSAHGAGQGAQKSVE